MLIVIGLFFMCCILVMICCEMFDLLSRMMIRGWGCYCDQVQFGYCYGVGVYVCLLFRLKIDGRIDVKIIEIGLV